MRHHRFTNSRWRIRIAGSDWGGRYKSKLEKDAFIRAFFLPGLKLLKLQEPIISYRDSEGEPHRYTGDLALNFAKSIAASPTVVECKYAQELKHDAELRAKLEILRECFSKTGKTFAVWTESEVYLPGFSMMRFVFDHRNNEPHSAQSEILWRVARSPSITVSEVIRDMRASQLSQLELVPEFWRLVSRGQLYVDFTKNLDLTAKLVPAPVLLN